VEGKDLLLCGFCRWSVYVLFTVYS
jgi:hypothetical protein